MRRPIHHPLFLALLGLSALAFVGCGGESTDPGTEGETSAADTESEGEGSSGAEDATEGSGEGNTTPVDPTPEPDTTTPIPDPVEDTQSGPDPIDDVAEPVEDTPSGPDPVEDVEEPEPEEVEEPEPEEEDVEEPVELCGNGVCDPTEACEDCAQDCPVCQPEPGDLVITEIMQNPKAVSDDTGEWIEILHIGDAPVELAGVVLRDNEDDNHVIAPEVSLVVSPGEYILLGASEDLGGVSADYAWFDYSLGNGSDEVIIEVDGVTIDAVAYDNGATFPDPNGASMSLSPEGNTPEGNDDASAWCAGQSAFASGDLGSPGEANPTCVTCGDGSCDESEACETCPADCGSCTPCDAGAVASDEVCNGIDDDCNGAVDDGVACDDGIACTEDYCDGASGCTAEPGDGACYIDGQCYDADDANPNNSCQVCDPGVTKEGWASTLLSLDCENEDPCTENGTCIAGFCVFSSEVPGDSYEPNESQGAATVLGDIKDDNEFPAGNFTGSLWPEGDVDWYTFHDEDVVTNISFYRPKAELYAPPGTDYRLCTFATCDNGEEPEIVDCEGGVAWSAEEGLSGCCASGSEALSIKMTLQCTFQGLLADSADIAIRVENQSDTWSCGDYELYWGDD